MEKRKLNIKITVSIIVVIIILFASALILRVAYQKYVEASYPLKYETEVENASQKYNVDKALIYGVIKTESNFDPYAVSDAGAVGLMQIMPETFEWLQTYYVEDNNYTSENLTDYRVSIDYGTHLLSILIDMYKNEDTAICAYNAGVGNVDGWLENQDYSRDGETLFQVPIAETKNYLKMVKQNKSIYNRLYFNDN